MEPINPQCTLLKWTKDTHIASNLSHAIGVPLEEGSRDDQFTPNYPKYGYSLLPCVLSVTLAGGGVGPFPEPPSLPHSYPTAKPLLLHTILLIVVNRQESLDGKVRLENRSDAIKCHTQKLFRRQKERLRSNLFDDDC